MRNDKSNIAPPQPASPMPMMPPPPQMAWQGNLAKKNKYSYFPSNMATSGIVVGLLALTIILFSFSNNLMPAYLYWIFIAELLIFFLGSVYCSQSWARYSFKNFVRHIFWIGLLLRVPFTVYHHVENVNLYGELYYGYLADVEVYVGLAKQAVDEIIQNSNWAFIPFFLKYLAFDDIGSPILNTFILLLTGNADPCVAVLSVNVILGAVTPIFMYNIARRHFGEDVGRMTAIFCMLNPNMIWWCCTMMKETQMVFFTCWFLDRMDAVLMRGKVSVAEVIPVAIIGMFVFLYRAALGILLFMAFFAALVLMSQRIVSMGKKILAGSFVVVVLLLGFGQQMAEQAQSLRKQALGDAQRQNMEWRTTRTHGNAFAKYASKTVFAPLIFTIPFPTLTYTHEKQVALMEVSGGNLIKNLLSFLVIVCMFVLLLSGEWRQHVFLLAYLIGYLAILAFSSYAQSGRFHVPAIPVEMMFAAYMLKIIQQNMRTSSYLKRKSTYMRWYTYWCGACVVFTVFWQWFKLKGQGII